MGNTYFQTSDITVSAYLRSKNIKLIDVKRDDRGKARFVFDTSGEEAQTLVREFYEDCPIGAKTFADNLRDIKGAIFNFQPSY